MIKNRKKSIYRFDDNNYPDSPGKLEFLDELNAEGTYRDIQNMPIPGVTPAPQQPIIMGPPAPANLAKPAAPSPYGLKEALEGLNASPAIPRGGPDTEDKIPPITVSQPSMNDYLAEALIGLGPTLVGAMFAGYRGGAVGGQAGITGLNKLHEMRKAQEKSALDLALKRLEAKRKGSDTFLLEQMKQTGQNKRAALSAIAADLRAKEANKSRADLTAQLIQSREGIAYDTAASREKIAQDELGEKKLSREQQKALEEQKIEEGKKQKKVKQEDDLRQEIKKDKIVDESVTIASAYDRVKKAMESPNAASDLSLIFAYMKILDPGSTVREGEFATAARAGSAWEVVGSLYNRVWSGERLTKAQRARFFEEAKKIYEGRQLAVEPVYKYYKGLADKRGLDINNVVFNPVSEFEKADQARLYKEQTEAAKKGKAATAPGSSAPPTDAELDKMSNEELKKYLGM